jgi:hypothetical protein
MGFVVSHLFAKCAKWMGRLAAWRAARAQEVLDATLPE